LYGDKVVIVGKELCEDFRQRVPLEKRRLAVAGMFNTGTNLLDTQMRKNIRMPSPTLWQVPWGKHRMAEVKWNHTAPGMMENIDKNHVLPIVMIRDPLSWMQSMCGHPYAAAWRHGQHHCPNLVPDDADREYYSHIKEAFEVTVKFDKHSLYHFASLVHLWSEWYAQYLEVDFPVLMGKFNVVRTMYVPKKKPVDLTPVASFPSNYQFYHTSQQCDSKSKYAIFKGVH
jgi:hypothetical protein